MNLTVLRSPDIDRASKFYSEMGLLFTNTVMDQVQSTTPHALTDSYSRFTRLVNTRRPSGLALVSRLMMLIQSWPCSLPSELNLFHLPQIANGRRAVVKDLDGHVVELLTPPNRDKIEHQTKHQPV